MSSSVFGIRVQELRKARGISQKELAIKLGIPQSTMSGYETGVREPKFELLSVLAAELETSVDYLLGVTSCPKVLAITT